jgi:DNA mismatch repair protein MSH3
VSGALGKPDRASRTSVILISRLAGLPKDVLDNAQRKADQLKIETERRLLASLARRTEILLLAGKGSGTATPADILKNAFFLYKTLGRLAKS